MKEMLLALLGLFVDDELLAVGVLGTVGLTVLLLDIIGIAPLAAGGILLSTNILVLVGGAVRTARRRP